MDTQMDMNDLQECAKSVALLPNMNRAAQSVHSELDFDFSSEEGMACCGEEIRPFWAEDGRYMGVCRGCGQKYTDKSQVRYKGTPWIGVDLDGTLAHDVSASSGSRSLGEIGTPIKPMLERLKRWIAEGRTVKIFTARASSPRQVVLVKRWLASHGLPPLEVTNVKDLRMIELWDDRCVQVMTNSGEPVSHREGIRRERRPTRSAGRTVSFSVLSRLRLFLTL